MVSPSGSLPCLFPLQRQSGQMRAPAYRCPTYRCPSLPDCGGHDRNALFPSSLLRSEPDEDTPAVRAGSGRSLAALPLLAQSEKIDFDAIARIKAEGMQRSQVMELNSWLSDVYAPRVTGSPTYDKAAKWAMDKMREWGLVNVKAEGWTDQRGFDRGWTNDKFYMQAISPERFPIPGTPTAWTPGTNGLVSGEVVLVTGTTAEDLAPFKGTLRGQVDHDAGRAGRARDVGGAGHALHG